MDKIKKFLLVLTKKERAVLQCILSDIQKMDIKAYDVKPLKGYENFYRLRKGKIRIIFAKVAGKGVTVDIGYRKDMYK